jgi:hypothetical protein
MAANKGNATVSFVLGVPSPFADGDLHFQSSLEISQDHWDGDHEHRLNLKVDGLWLSQAGLWEMHQQLSTWVRKPIRELANSVLRSEFEVAAISSQRLRLVFGPREDTIDERKPVLTLEVQAGALGANIHFVTDQSCISIFLDELSTALSGSPRESNSPGE